MKSENNCLAFGLCTTLSSCCMEYALDTWMLCFACAHLILLLLFLVPISCLRSLSSRHAYNAACICVRSSVYDCVRMTSSLQKLDFKMLLQTASTPCTPECVDDFMHLVPNVRIKSVFVHKGIRYVSICKGIMSKAKEVTLLIRSKINS